ncbi:MAG: major capsid protein [Gammaproteobacteria bacterium]|nr:major capsid protein [Gammaproteobacteria bacterium]
MDFYRDYFTREQLLLSLANTPYTPGLLGRLGLFQTLNLTGTTLAIEALPANDVAEAAAIPRGAPPKPLTLEKRRVETFTTGTYAWQGAVYADEVLNLRAAGTSGAAEVFSQRRDEVTAKLRRQADFQHEYLRMACLNNPTNVFGSAPAAAVVAFGATDSAMRTALHNHIVLPLESALQGIPYSGIDAFCSDAYWVALIESQTIKDTYLNTAAAAELRNAPADSFSYGGITWHRYRAGGTIAITAGTAKVVPRGVSGLFVQAFAPNDTLSSVGQGAMGMPYYLDSYPIDDDKGFRITLQTHPAMLCTRPAAILTVDLS